MKPARTRALYVGSFDPITRGHLDIVEKALRTFDLVHIAVGTNPLKAGLFGVAERLDLIAASIADIALPIAPAPLAREVLRHTPPTPLEIEQAIEWVEDAVMPARARLPEAFELQVEDALLRELVGSAGADPSTGGVARLSIQDVEKLFSRLVALSEGRPATQDGLPSDGASAARLIILREVLHHWGQDGVWLV